MIQTPGHLQPESPIKTDNGTTAQFAHDTNTNKHSGAWDI